MNKNYNLICTPAIKYKFVKSCKLWCRTWFELDKDGWHQRQAWSRDRKAEWNAWSSSL